MDIAALRTSSMMVNIMKRMKNLWLMLLGAASLFFQKTFSIPNWCGLSGCSSPLSIYSGIRFTANVYKNASFDRDNP